MKNDNELIFSSNPKTVKSLIFDVNERSDNELVYLGVTKSTKMNKEDRPCEENSNYILSKCIQNYIDQEINFFNKL